MEPALSQRKRYIIDTTGKFVFAVRQNLCRAFFFGRTAKSLFAVRFL
jgi:hypothetical protein